MYKKRVFQSLKTVFLGMLKMSTGILFDGFIRVLDIPGTNNFIVHNLI
jgi:hypothetical protein